MSTTTTASQPQASRMTAAPPMVIASRPACRLRTVWFKNMVSWARQSRRPTASASAIRAIGLTLETTQHRPDVLLMASGEVEKDLFQRLPIMPDLMPELLQAAQREQAAVVDDAEPGAHPLGDLEDVRRKEHGLSLFTEVLEDVLHLARAERVQAHGRLIKKEDLGIMEQGRRQRYLLPHAARICRQEVIGAA